MKKSEPIDDNTAKFRIANAIKVVKKGKMNVKIRQKLVILFTLTIISFVLIGFSYYQVMFGGWDSLYLTSAISFFGTLLIILLGYIGGSLWRSLARIESAMTKITQGNTDVRVRLDSGDELGQFADAFDNLMDNQAKAEAKVKQENQAVLALLQGVN